MKFILLPIQLIKFWFPESFSFFILTWKNLISYLEEDLAVGLMLKLFFTPLFHDASIVGKVLSVIFRLIRIFLGIFAFIIATLIIIITAVFWFTLPFSAFIAKGDLGFAFKLILFSGVVLFVRHLIAHPLKKLWQIKKAEEVWQCSFVDKNKLDLKTLLKNGDVIKFLTYLEKTPDDFINFPKIYSEAEMRQKALELGRKIKTPYLRSEHFFTATILSILNVENELMKMDLTQEDLIDALDYLQKRADRWRLVPIWDEDFAVHHLRGINRGWLGTPTPELDLASDDLTKIASKENIPDFIGRKEIISQIINILSLSEGRNVVIVGEPGSGKSALVNFLAKIIVAGDAPSTLATKRLVFLDFTRLLSGIKDQGDLAERVNNIFEEANYSANIIIFVDEIQNFGLGEAGIQYNLLSLIVPVIESSKVQFITTTEPANYAKVLERNGSFLRLFTKVDLPPATSGETVEILKDRSIDFERREKIKTSILAMKKVVNLSEKYIRNRVLPDSALHIYKLCQVNGKNGWITKEVVEKTVQTEIKIPFSNDSQDANKQILNMEETIHLKLIDQEEAVSAVANALKRSQANLRDKNRPVGTFLFVGPTGVGKTELAKILSEVYFLEKGNFLRLDMSEFQTNDAIERLLGSENNEGLLTDAVRIKPFTLILLDEFEKADQKILNLFLQVLDDGRLTDGKGRVVDFTNTIIIATSNAGSLIIAENLAEGKTVEEIKPLVKDELMKVLSPELLNRFDEMVIFKPLSPEDLQKIVVLKLETLKSQLKEQGYIVEFSNDLIIKLAEKGFDPVMGARPLRRLIQDTLEARLSVLILEKKLPKGEKFLADVSLLG